MSVLDVALGERSYPIYIQSALIRSDSWYQHLGSQVLIVTNETLLPIYGQPLHQALRDWGVSKLGILPLPDGEVFKNLETLNKIFDALLQSGFNRNATLVALGGGVVGDMTGFAAACYQRGVNFVQVPTTLLAQVDSSVGGKTGVNHALGKNMIGAFYQPKCVVIDLDVLKTLPQRELSAGLAEVIKYGLIYDEAFFVWLEHNMPALMRKDTAALEYAIEQSCRVKADVVVQDEREGGIRAILNLGHTFGHAIEAHTGYGAWLHGEAVAVGMLMACDLSVRLGWIGASVEERALKLVMAAGLPYQSPAGMTSGDYLKFMAVDKKVLDKALRLVLLKGLGRAVVTQDFDSALLDETLVRFCSG